MIILFLKFYSNGDIVLEIFFKIFLLLVSYIFLLNYGIYCFMEGERWILFRIKFIG